MFAFFVAINCSQILGEVLKSPIKFGDAFNETTQSPHTGG
jgi:hypothetical protein